MKIYESDFFDDLSKLDDWLNDKVSDGSTLEIVGYAPVQNDGGATGLFVTVVTDDNV